MCNIFHNFPVLSLLSHTLLSCIYKYTLLSSSNAVSILDLTVHNCEIKCLEFHDMKGISDNLFEFQQLLIK